MALVETPRVDLFDVALINEMQRAAWTGITGAPFGWPDDLLATLHTYAETCRWPLGIASERIRRRLTDRFVSDLLQLEHDVRIEIPAGSLRENTIATWRVAQLLTAHANHTGRQLDRVGVPAPTGLDGPPDLPRGLVKFPPHGVIEAHAQAALAAWGLPYDDYRPTDVDDPTDAREQRARILDQLEDEATWMILTDDARSMCETHDDALDALIAAFVACATATDVTIKPTVKQRGAAQREGWIHLPPADTLSALAPS